MDLLTRFHSKIRLNTNGCHEWDAAKDQKGYGRFGVKYKTVRAHIFSFELYKGKIPNGLELDHLCRNRGCVNPSHLEAVTSKENRSRGIHNNQNRNKTHCIYGHEFNNTNTYITPRGCRVCKMCKNIRQRERRSKNII